MEHCIVGMRCLAIRWPSSVSARAKRRALSFAAADSLSSSPWFISRQRTGVWCRRTASAGTATVGCNATCCLMPTRRTAVNQFLQEGPPVDKQKGLGHPCDGFILAPPAVGKPHKLIPLQWLARLPTIEQQRRASFRSTPTCGFPAQWSRPSVQQRQDCAHEKKPRRP